MDRSKCATVLCACLVWLVASCGGTGTSTSDVPDALPAPDESGLADASPDADAPVPGDIKGTDKAGPIDIEVFEIPGPTDVDGADNPAPADLEVGDVPALADVEVTDTPAPADVEVADTPTPADVNESDTSAPPPPLFDHKMIRDASTAACSFTDKHSVFKDGVLLDAWKVTYYSWESIDGELHPIQIRGFAARPALGGGNLPGIIHAHGLGGYADEDAATGPAALLGTFVLAYTGPGGGTEPSNTSEGMAASAENGYKMFDTIEDLRGSWFWGHAVAAMRGLTCLENHPDVDETRLGITGFSAGGVISHIVAGVDDRTKAAVPLSGVLAWDVAVQSPDAWQHALLKQAGLTSQSPEWTALMDLVNPQLILAGTQAKVFEVNGSCDEFFPLTAHLATYNALPADNRRLSLVANFDHGCYKLTGGEGASTIEERADLRAKGAQRAWFHHVFGTDSDYTYIPQPPAVSITPLGAFTLVGAVVDAGGSKLSIEEVKVWASNDQAFLFAGMALKNQGGTLYSEVVPVVLDGNSVYYVDVQYKTADFLFPERFSVSSPPVIPPGQIPHIRDINSCL